MGATPSLVSGSIQLTVGGTIKNTLAGSLGVVTAPSQSITIAQAFAQGTSGAGKAARVWEGAARVLAGSANETLDFNALAGIDIGAGAGNDAVGAAWLCVEIMGLLIQNTGSDTLAISQPSSPVLVMGGTTPTLTLKAGQFLLIGSTGAAGITVGSGAKNLEFTAGAGGTTYSVLVIGR